MGRRLPASAARRVCRHRVGRDPPHGTSPSLADYRSSGRRHRIVAFGPHKRRRRLAGRGVPVYRLCCHLRRKSPAARLGRTGWGSLRCGLRARALGGTDGGRSSFEGVRGRLRHPRPCPPDEAHSACGFPECRRTARSTSASDPRPYEPQGAGTSSVLTRDGSHGRLALAPAPEKRGPTWNPGIATGAGRKALPAPCGLSGSSNWRAPARRPRLVRREDTPATRRLPDPQDLPASPPVADAVPHVRLPLGAPRRLPSCALASPAECGALPVGAWDDPMRRIAFAW